MNRIVITDKLTSNQLRDAKQLIQQCCEADGTRGISFLEGDINGIDKFPAFFLMYEENTLISMVSIFVPDFEECELYAATLPEYRRKGCFIRLYKRAYKTIQAFRIRKISFPNEPGNSAGEGVLKKIGAHLKSSEYLMSCDISACQKPKGVLKLAERKKDRMKEGTKIDTLTESAKESRGEGSKESTNIDALAECAKESKRERSKESTNIDALTEHEKKSGGENKSVQNIFQNEIISMKRDGVKVGSVYVELENGTASIYNVEVKPEFRGMGYGTETLLLTLEYLRKFGCKRVLLHVSSLNEIAYGMYCRYGFVIEQQMDYWEKELII